MTNKFKRIAYIMILISYLFGCTSLEGYLKDKNYWRAKDYAEKQKGEKQRASYNKIADTYFIDKNYEEAAKFYEKAYNKDGMKKIADVYFQKKKYEIASSYYEKAEDTDGIKNIADTLFVHMDYLNAGHYYGKINNNEGLKKIADELFAIDDYLNAGIFYNKIEDKDNLNRVFTALNLYYNSNYRIFSKIDESNIMNVMEIDNFEIEILSGICKIGINYRKNDELPDLQFVICIFDKTSNNVFIVHIAEEIAIFYENEIQIISAENNYQHLGMGNKGVIGIWFPIKMIGKYDITGKTNNVIIIIKENQPKNTKLLCFPILKEDISF